MAPVATIKLDVNIPLVGTVKYIDFYDEKENPNEPGKVLPAQWGLNGDWVGQGKGKVYIDDYQLETNLVNLGFAAPAANGDYRWIFRGPVRLVKREGEKRRRFVSVTPADGTAAPVPAAAAPAAAAPPASARSASAPAQRREEPPPPQEPADAAYDRAADAATAAQAQTFHAPPMSEARAVGIRKEWADMAMIAEQCRAIACQVFGEDYEPRALVAFTSTLFIEANRRNMPPSPPRKKEATP